jgi:hypothetical protein
MSPAGGVSRDGSRILRIWGAGLVSRRAGAHADHPSSRTSPHISAGHLLMRNQPWRSRQLDTKRVLAIGVVWWIVVKDQTRK